MGRFCRAIFVMGADLCFVFWWETVGFSSKSNSDPCFYDHFSEVASDVRDWARGSEFECGAVEGVKTALEFSTSVNSDRSLRGE